jgi:hypothetical protein
MKLLLETPSDQFVAKELVALAINLAANQHSTEQMIENDGLRLILARVKKTWDPLLMKLIRNISQHDGKVKDSFMVNIAQM